MKCLIESQRQTQTHTGEMRSLQSLTFLLLVSAAQVTGLEGKMCHTPGPPKDKMVAMFCDFMWTYNKSYKDQEEEARRFKIFVENLERARQRQETEIGSARYGVTKFSDLSAEEFQQGTRAPSVPLQCEIYSDKLTKEIRESKDWRQEKRVTPVQDQKLKCKSCWAFAVVGNVESHVSIWKNELITLSVQELLDCGTKTDDCKDGYIDVAFQDVVSRGLNKEGAYDPYTAERHICRRKKNEPVYKIKKCVRLPRNETEIQRFVAEKGPVAVLVNLLNSLRLYTDGIMQSSQTIENGLYHAMLIVGYGTENGTPYWIVKNSWGGRWGEKGYVRIYRGGNVGKIQNFAMSSIV